MPTRPGNPAHELTVHYVPDKTVLPSPTYANATFTYATDADVTICFLLAPLLDEEEVRLLATAADGVVQVPAPVMATISLSHLRARQLADKLHELIGKAGARHA